MVEGARPGDQAVPRGEWYLLPTLVKHGLRFELPYQERLMRVGAELGRRLHEHDMHWWDVQLKEYQALPAWKDFPALWEAIIGETGGRSQDYPFWLLTARSMQYAWGANVGIQLMHEVADNIAGHRGVVINTAGRAAARHRRRRCHRDLHAAGATCTAARCCARASAPTRCC